MVCPYGAIHRNMADKKIASKCDLCAGEEVPACVKNCPNEALVFEDRSPNPDVSS
jgi:carbon-monoxide dehydrogenase iron sulfur subunit